MVFTQFCFFISFILEASHDYGAVRNANFLRPVSGSPPLSAIANSQV